MPSFINLPPGYGGTIVEPANRRTATYEPFAQGWFYDIGSFAAIAPSDGAYYLAVFDPRSATGSYAVTVGYLEKWTLPELIALPWNIKRIQIWEGQNVLAALSPFFAILVLGSLWLFVRHKKGKGPGSLSQWFASLGGLAYAASAVASLHQMLLAARFAPIPARDFTITLTIASIPAILAVIVLNYGLQKAKSFKITQRIGLVATSVVGLILFTGLYLGPTLTLLAAIVKPANIHK